MPSGEIPPKYPIYTGEEDEDYADLFSIEEVYGGETSMDAMGKDQWPFVDIKEETYKKLWEPCRRALIIKVLGRAINLSCWHNG